MKIETSLLTPEQVAEILQIHVLTVYHYIRQGKLSAIRLGRSYRIVPEDLNHLIEDNRVQKQTISK
jgi:excisionase family DNA binding protein